MGRTLSELMLEQPLLAIARASRGLRRVRRPATVETPEFDLSYVRTGGRSGRTPVVVIPGGPGLGSVLPYRNFRGIAERRGLDLLMVEHRGVGLSRRDLAGRDLPLESMRISYVLEDLAAVLDREGIDRAHMVGSSYGSYLASCFGMAYPERVAGMILDSALQSADELALERQVIRELFWDADSEAAGLVRRLTEAGIDQRILLDVSRAAYELGGEGLLVPLLRRRAREVRSHAWRALEAYATRDATMSRIPAIYEFDLVGAIGFRELGYGSVPDGRPLDPALTYAPLASGFPLFSGEPYDLAEGVAGFHWPLVAVSGSRDLRTPPAIAQRVVERAPDAVLVPIENGHSALDTHPVALLNAIDFLVAGRQSELPGAARSLDRLPKRGVAARAPEILKNILARGRG